jgi:hypothetical protein
MAALIAEVWDNKADVHNASTERSTVARELSLKLKMILTGPRAADRMKTMFGPFDPPPLQYLHQHRGRLIRDAPESPKASDTRVPQRKTVPQSICGIRDGAVRAHNFGHHPAGVLY